MASSDVQGGEVSDTWRNFTNAEEDQRLSVIDDRLGRISARATELYQEKGRIMQRAIRRMRRARGKT